MLGDQETEVGLRQDGVRQVGSHRHLREQVVLGFDLEAGGWEVQG
jgi:hypothetical protein